MSRPAAAGRPLEEPRPAPAATWPRLSVLASPGVLVAALVALGAGLRFYALGGRSFWIDEVSTTDALWLASPGDVFNWCRSFQQGPLFFLADWQAAHYGIDEFTLRVPSALAGTLAVYFGFRLGDALYGRATGALTALLMATMFFPVWYSQEARPYAFMILLATAQAYCTFQAVRLGRARDWAGLAAATLLGLYNHYLALAATAACAVFIGANLAVGAWRAWRRRPGASRRAVLVGVVAAADCAALVVVGYLSWLRSLVQFLQGDQASSGYLALHSGRGFNPADVAALVDTFGFRGLLAVLLAAGAVGAFLRARRGDALASALLLALVAVPLCVLAVKLQGAVFAVWARYLGFLFPPLAVLAALGAVEGAAWLAAAYTRWRPAAGPRMAPIALAAVTVLTAAQALAILVPSYGYPKDDYRGAMSYVVAHGSSRDVVVPAGANNIFLAEGFPYYSKRLGAEVLVADADYLTGYRELPGRLREPCVTVWVAVPNADDPHGLRAENYLASATGYTDLAQYPHPGLRLVRFQGVTLVRTADTGLSPLEQAITILRWAAEFDVPMRPELKGLLETVAPPSPD